ncbi:MAG: AAA family ATPase, partial [Clostridia bacterium]|nr:AAA family ATPase [Clostridia bacterium]
MRNVVPLAERMRPEFLSEFVGQKHIIGKNMLLWRAIMMGEVGSCIFYGPPGTGKTTLANIIAKNLNGNFRKLNAVSSGVS